MSRVTFGDLYLDFIDADTPVEDCMNVQSVEIVPRKMVEMIIERCRVLVNAEDVQQYAQALLDMFEEE